MLLAPVYGWQIALKVEVHDIVVVSGIMAEQYVVAHIVEESLQSLGRR